MSWILPTPLQLFAGVVAFVPAWPRMRRPVSLARLMAEAFAITLAVTAVAGWDG